MSAASLLPHIPQPPHDPTSLRLGGRSGWRPLADAAANVAFTEPVGELRLATRPAFRRSLDEPNGSFGGLRAPWNVALGPGGEIYLLDHAGLTLKIFDPCACVFLKTPCFGGQGAARRQLNDPGGIGICGGNLYVCDTGNHRLGVFSLTGYALRGYWAPPTSAALAPWSPKAVAFDSRGRMYVSDPANGGVHRFSPAGEWLEMLGGLGDVSHLVVDCEDRLWAVATSAAGRAVLSINVDHPGDRAALDMGAAAGRLPPLPFSVDAAGRLHLGALCPSEEHASPDCAALARREPGTDEEREEPGAPERGVFTPDGVPWQPPPGMMAALPPPFPTEGVYCSAALDSAIHRCQWHRVLLEGETPSGSYLLVTTFTSEVELPAAEVAALPPEAWQGEQAARLQPGAPWDCLVLSPPGRYLWLRLQLRSTGMVTPVVLGAEIEFPRISLRRYLPAVFGEEPVSADFTDRFLAIFDTTLRSIEGRLDRLAAYFDPLSAPAGEDDEADFLSWLGGWIGIMLERSWSVERKRRFLKEAGRLFPLRGTQAGLRQYLLIYFGMDQVPYCCAEDRRPGRCDMPTLNCRVAEPPRCAWRAPELILEHFQLRRWLYVGHGALGDQATLWGESIANRSRLDHTAQTEVTRLKMTPDPQRDPFLVYAHRYTVFAPACAGKDEASRRALHGLLARESPAHTTYDVRWVEPRFRIGVQSTIGLDAVIGRIPEGVLLDGNAGDPNAPLLGRDTVLTGSAGAWGPSTRVGPSAGDNRTPQVGGMRLD